MSGGICAAGRFLGGWRMQARQPFQRRGKDRVDRTARQLRNRKLVQKCETPTLVPAAQHESEQDRLTQFSF